MSSCHSSTTTARRSANISRALSRDSMSDSDSGVVTSAVGRRRACRARIAAEVSPVRDSSVHGSPRSTSGWRSASSVSAASARSGVIHSTRSGGALFRRGRFPRSAAGMSVCSSIHSPTGPPHAANVFPVPVAAWIKPLSPDRYASQTSRWKRERRPAPGREPVLERHAAPIVSEYAFPGASPAIS